MATYAEQFTLSQDSTFQGRVRVATVKAAASVFTLTQPTLAQLSLGKEILRDPATYTPLVAQLVMNDAVVAASAPTGTALTDVQLQSAVNTYLNNLTR